MSEREARWEGARTVEGEEAIGAPDESVDLDAETVAIVRCVAWSRGASPWEPMVCIFRMEG